MDDKKIDDLIAELLKNDSEECVTKPSDSHNMIETQPPIDKVEKPKESYTSIIVAVVVIVVIIATVLIIKGRNERNYDMDYEEFKIGIVEDNSWAEDSLAIVKKTTPDLIFFELHGPVKKMVETSSYRSHSYTYEFDRDGNLIKLDGYNPFTVDVYGEVNGEYNYDLVRYNRDHNGRIVETSGWESSTEYSWNSGRPSEVRWNAEGMGGSYTREYNGNGFVIADRYSWSIECGEEIDDCSVYTYSHSNLDEYGNWRTRKGDEIITRRIEYYPISKSY